MTRSFVCQKLRKDKIVKITPSGTENNGGALRCRFSASFEKNEGVGDCINLLYWCGLNLENGKLFGLKGDARLYMYFIRSVIM